jgi:4'-phosphopantetheinyl transferase
VTASTEQASDYSLGPSDLHIWLCLRERFADSSDFIRAVLSRYEPSPPQDWQFSVGEFGKPAIVGAVSALDFNLSGSRDWLACAVTAGSAVGVDIEYCDPRRDVSRLAQRFFLPQECADIQSCAPADRVARFYDYWTLKEARVKALGGALGHQLTSLGFTLGFPGAESPESELGEIVAEPRSDESLAHYLLFDLPADYRLATCWLRAVAGPVHLKLYEWRGSADVRAAAHTLKAQSSP